MRRVADGAVGITLLQVFGATVATSPDPHVGLRVRGLTQALWHAVARGWLQPSGGASFVLTGEARRNFGAQLARLDDELVAALRQVGEAWASASTDRKKAAKARWSPAAT